MSNYSNNIPNDSPENKSWFSDARHRVAVTSTSLAIAALALSPIGHHEAEAKAPKKQTTKKAPKQTTTTTTKPPLKKIPGLKTAVIEILEYGKLTSAAYIISMTVCAKVGVNKPDVYAYLPYDPDTFRYMDEYGLGGSIDYVEESQANGPANNYTYATSIGRVSTGELFAKVVVAIDADNSLCPPTIDQNTNGNDANGDGWLGGVNVTASRKAMAMKNLLCPDNHRSTPEVISNCGKKMQTVSDPFTSILLSGLPDEFKVKTSPDGRTITVQAQP